MSSSTNQPTPTTSRGFLETMREMQLMKNYGMLFFFCLLVVFNIFYTPNFLSLGTLENTLRQAVPIIIVGLGMTMVISSGGIDISVGAIMAISAAVSARMYTAGVGIIPAVACGILAAAICGLLNGVLVARFKIQPIIVTLVVMFAGRGFAQMILGEFPISLSDTPFDEFGTCKVAGVLIHISIMNFILYFKTSGVPISIVIMAIAVAIMLFVARKTIFARRVEAIGENSEAARLAGINIFSVTVGVYVLCGILCGVAGNIEATEIASVNAAKLGQYLELDAIAAVAIGGTAFSGGRARILGTVFGAVVVQLVTVIVNMNDIPHHYSLVFKALVLIVAIWSQRDK